MEIVLRIKYFFVMCRKSERKSQQISNEIYSNVPKTGSWKHPRDVVLREPNVKRAEVWQFKIWKDNIMFLLLNFCFCESKQIANCDTERNFVYWSCFYASLKEKVSWNPYKMLIHIITFLLYEGLKKLTEKLGSYEKF